VKCNHCDATLGEKCDKEAFKIIMSTHLNFCIGPLTWPCPSGCGITINRDSNRSRNLVTNDHVRNSCTNEFCTSCNIYFIKAQKKEHLETFHLAAIRDITCKKCNEHLGKSQTKVDAEKLINEHYKQCKAFECTLCKIVKVCNLGETKETIQSTHKDICPYFYCKPCKTRVLKTDINDHNYSMHEQKCVECDAKFSNGKELDKHLKTCTLVKCTYCDNKIEKVLLKKHFSECNNFLHCEYNKKLSLCTNSTCGACFHPNLESHSLSFFKKICNSGSSCKHFRKDSCKFEHPNYCIAKEKCLMTGSADIECTDQNCPGMDNCARKTCLRRELAEKIYWYTNLDIATAQKCGKENCPGGKTCFDKISNFRKFYRDKYPPRSIYATRNDYDPSASASNSSGGGGAESSKNSSASASSSSGGGGTESSKDSSLTPPILPASNVQIYEPVDISTIYLPFDTKSESKFYSLDKKASDYGTSAINLIGEYLYAIIGQKNGSVAGKVTGMLLEMDLDELLKMVESNSHELLQDKFNEAIDVLKNAV